jgi:prepilin-type N-terminal cleavage/methylation domain-containing protein
VFRLIRKRTEDRPKYFLCRRISLKCNNLVTYNKKNNKRGFTLIEVLAVLTILGILMTIALIFMGNQGKRARFATATSSVKSAMTIAATCQVLGGVISDPESDNRDGGGNYICSGVSQVSNTVWPLLPEKCSYCGKGETGTDDETKIWFQCLDESVCSGNESDYSYCDYDTTQCVQN